MGVFANPSLLEFFLSLLEYCTVLGIFHDGILYLSTGIISPFLYYFVNFWKQGRGKCTLFPYSKYRAAVWASQFWLGDRLERKKSYSLMSACNCTVHSSLMFQTRVPSFWWEMLSKLLVYTCTSALIVLHLQIRLNSFGHESIILFVEIFVKIN